MQFSGGFWLPPLLIRESEWIAKGYCSVLSEPSDLMVLGISSTFSCRKRRNLLLSRRNIDQSAISSPPLRLLLSPRVKGTIVATEPSLLARAGAPGVEIKRRKPPSCAGEISLMAIWFRKLFRLWHVVSLGTSWEPRLIRIIW